MLTAQLLQELRLYPTRSLNTRSRSTARALRSRPVEETRRRSITQPLVVPLLPDLQNFGQDVFDTVREPLLVLDSGLLVRSANASFYETFRVSPAETENQHVYELGNGQWGLPALRDLLEDIVPRSSVFNDFVLEHDFPKLGTRIF